MHRLLKKLVFAAAPSMRPSASAAEIGDASYPSRPIRMVFGYARLRRAQAMIRVLARKLGSCLGQPVRADSRLGMDGTLGLAEVVRAAPDGYTLLVSGTTTMAAARDFCKRSPDDPGGDFVPVALICPLPQETTEDASMPAGDLRRSIAWLMARCGKVDGIYAPPGTSVAIVDRLADAVTRTVQTYEVRKALAKLGVDFVVLTGPALRAYLDQGDPPLAAARVHKGPD